jgi:hypothetical protein
MLIGLFFQVLLIALVVLWVASLGWEGALETEWVGAALVGLVVLSALGKAAGFRGVRLVFRVFLPLATLATFVIWQGQGDPKQMIAILGPLLALIIALFGLYIIVYGAIRKRYERARSRYK